MRWKLLILGTLAAYALACAPKRNVTQFAKNKEAEAGQTYTEEQLRAALGSDRYDSLIVGIGQDNLNLLTYGIGVSNMTTLMNAIPTPGKLPALMSDGPNSTKLTAIEVLDFLNKLDDACQLDPDFLPNGNDTIMKMAQMVNGVTVAGMEGIKNILHGVQIQSNDAFGAPYSTNAVSRLALLVAMLNENAAPSVMAQLINNVAAPGGNFSASGTAKLIRMVNETEDLWNLYIIIDEVTSIGNITDVMLGLTGNMYCSKPWYLSQGSCLSNGGSWTNTNCTNPAYSTRASCTGNGGTWTSDGIENMTQVINQLSNVCSGAYPNAMLCRSNSEVWSTMASKIPVIVNNITNVPNMFTIVNGLTNDGTAYAGGTPDGVDTMVATINNIWNSGMGDANIYGTNGVKRLAYMVNQLDPSPLYGNDSDFENGGSCSNSSFETQAACTGGGGTWTPSSGYDCANGNFDNRLNWAFSDNGSVAAPYGGKSWASTSAEKHAGSCSIGSDPAVVPALPNAPVNATQSAELVFNLTTAGDITFYTKTDTLAAGDYLRVFLDDVLQGFAYTNGSGAGFQLRTVAAVPTGVHRLRFDVHRLVGSSGRAFIDTVTLRGTKGAGRTAAEKTYIMMNQLYLASSINNVATLINTVTAPACVATPLTCTATGNNGMDTLIYIVNRSEYPTSLATIPRLAVTVNAITNLTEMVGILDGISSAAAQAQLVSMMDHVQTAANVPDLVNGLGAGGGVKTRMILNNLTAAGTSNMLRVLANTPTGAPLADVVTLINGATSTGHVGQLLTKLPLTGNVNIATVETYFASPTGGAKLAQFFNRINTVSAANTQNCTTGTESDFCVKNHLVRLVNDVANSTYGPATIAAIVGGMRPDAGPGGSTGVERMTDAMFFLKSMNATRYGGAILNPVDTTKNGDDFGRLDAFIADLGATGGATTARMVNEVTYSKINSHVGNLIKNTNRIKYLSRFVSELTNVGLIIDILNGLATVAKIQNLMNDMGDTTATVWGVGTDAATLTAWNTATKYTNMNEYWATDSDKLGKTITFMNNISGGSTNVVTLLDGINFTDDTNQQRFPILKDLVKNVHRVSYVTRILNESTSVSLVISLINAAPIINPSTGSPFTEAQMITRITDRFGGLVNEMGDATTKTSTDSPGGGCTPSGTPGADCAQPTTKYGDTAANFGYGCAAMPGFSNGRGCDTNITDKLGRVIAMLNEITAISNTVALMLGAEDFGYVKALINNTSTTTPTGVRRMRYLTYIVNNLTNVDLMVRVINGADACSRYVAGVNTVTDTAGTCATAGGIWGGVGRCVDPANPTSTAVVAGVTTLTTKAACTTTSARVWRGAEYGKLLTLINSVGDSELKGNVNAGDLLGAGMGTKAVGELYVLVDTMNQLGYSGVTPRTLGQQVRVVRVINQVQYCGLKPQYDKRIQSGPVCLNSNSTTAADTAILTDYQSEEACIAAGYWWKSKWNNAGTSNWVPASTMFNLCNDPTYEKPSTAQPTPGVYYADGDRYDGRHRIGTLMLGVTNGSAFSVVVGDVQETQKTINMVNGVRRARTLSQFLAWLPGTVTAALVNNAQSPAILRSLVYLANNLEETEDATAKAFAQMVHFGTRIRAQGNTDGAPTCLEFTGLGPRRLAAVLNLEAGPYLEGLVANLGWQISVAAMNCGWGRDDGQNTGNCSPEDGGTGGMYKPVGASYVGDPKPTNSQCVRPRELTDGYRYGNWQWGGNQGTYQANCQSIAPEKSGAVGCDKNTDEIIWSGLSSVNSGIGQDGAGNNDMWAVLKGSGSGLVGSLMNSDTSYVGFPPPRVYSDTENCTQGLKGTTSATCGGGITTRCTDNEDDTDNWQCVREGLVAGDLRPGDTGNGFYWGTYCAAGDSPNPAAISGTQSSKALAQSCITNGGTWKTEKNYMGPSCNLDPSILGAATPKLGPP